MTMTSGFEQRLLEALTEMDAARVAPPPPVTALRPRRRRRVVLVTAGATAVAALGAVAAVAAVIPESHVFAASETAVIGGPMFVKGTGCRPGVPVTFSLGGTEEIGTTNADDRGDFYATLTLPARTAPGKHTVLATCAGAGTQRAPLNAVTEAPPEPPMLDIPGATAGATTFAKGTGCRPGTTVTVTLPTTPAATVTVTASSSGSFVGELAVPASVKEGSYVATATCVGRDGQPLTLRTEVAVAPAK